MAQRGPGTKGRMLSSAASSTVSAIKASTAASGGSMAPLAARPSVTEWAAVKAVTSFNVSASAPRALSRGAQPAPSRRHTATSSSVTRNSTWSSPLAMWAMPAPTSPARPKPCVASGCGPAPGVSSSGSAAEPTRRARPRCAASVAANSR